MMRYICRKFPKLLFSLYPSSFTLLACWLRCLHSSLSWRCHYIEWLIMNGKRVHSSHRVLETLSDVDRFNGWMEWMEWSIGIQRVVECLSGSTCVSLTLWANMMHWTVRTFDWQFDWFADHDCARERLRCANMCTSRLLWDHPAM